MKTHATHLSMDEKSYLMSCPDDECVEKEERQVMLGEWYWTMTGGQIGRFRTSEQ
jgi:hypothetical protein